MRRSWGLLCGRFRSSPPPPPALRTPGRNCGLRSCTSVKPQAHASAMSRPSSRTVNALGCFAFIRDHSPSLRQASPAPDSHAWGRCEVRSEFSARDRGSHGAAGRGGRNGRRQRDQTFTAMKREPTTLSAPSAESARMASASRHSSRNLVLPFSSTNGCEVRPGYALKGLGRYGC